MRAIKLTSQFEQTQKAFSSRLYQPNTSTFPEHYISSSYFSIGQILIGNLNCYLYHCLLLTLFILSTKTFLMKTHDCKLYFIPTNEHPEKVYLLSKLRWRTKACEVFCCCIADSGCTCCWAWDHSVMSLVLVCGQPLLLSRSKSLSSSINVIMLQ